MFIYENHMGGLYAYEDELDYEQLYCDQCGDCDYLIGEANSRDEAWRLLKDDVNDSGGWDYDYIQECLDKWFPDVSEE